MDDDQLAEEHEARGLSGESARKIGHTALSIMLATSLASALSVPPNTDLVTLPDPTPIIQVYEPPVEEEVLPEDDEESPSEESLLRKLLRILKYLLIALLVTGAIVFGALKGCASCAGPVVAPTDEPEQQEQVEETQAEEAQPEEAAN